MGYQGTHIHVPLYSDQSEASMKNLPTFLTIITLFTALVLTMVGCRSKITAEDTYWLYWEACTKGEFIRAKDFLTEEAIASATTLGVCAFTHDAINTIETQQGNPLRTFSQDPTVNEREGIASLTWVDDQGNLASVILVNVDEAWKVTEANWSY